MAATRFGALIRDVDHGFVFLAIVLLVCGRVPLFPVFLEAQQIEDLGVVRGVVVDAATGTPLTRVLVVDQGSNLSAVTGPDGRFELRLTPSERRLKASVVGYAVAERAVTVVKGATVDVTIPLVGGTGAYEEAVTVSADRFRTADPGAPAQQVLGSADIQNLRGVLADDPLRAVQVLPGVATGDDLRSEFSVRGSNFTHMHQTIDGFTTPYLLHAVRAVEDASSSGSIAMINSDILQDVALVSGGYVQRSGNRTGASVDFNIRAGSRDRPIVRAAVSGTNASVVAEGPIGSSAERRGSWLVSGRQSYLDLLIDRLVNDQIKFGFSDAQAKLQYDLASNQRVELTVLAGRSELEEPPDQIDANALYIGKNASAVSIAKWTMTRARTMVSAGVLGGANQFRNETLSAEELDNGHERQLAGRVDVRHQVSSSFDVESGADVDLLWETRQRRRPVGSASYRVVNDYTGQATRSGAYGTVRWTPLPTFSISPGVRVDHWTLTGQSTASPWMQAEWHLTSSTAIRGAAGIYQQFPTFEQIIGAWGTEGLGRERATHVDLAVERTFGASRVQVTVYDRQEDNFLRRPGAESRVVNGRLIRGSTAARYQTRLDGYARGIEFFVQRLDSNGFSGWASYAYGRNRYHDFVSDETFWGDFDQRHTVNLYGLYRLSPRMSVSSKLRIGSNFPAPGYYTESDGKYFIGEARNEVRLPSFARLDLRVNRTFSWSTRRLTLFAEVINVLNRENVRYHPPSINPQTFEARRLFESLLPVVPSAGILVEF
jgi:hypothetical protein